MQFQTEGQTIQVYLQSSPRSATSILLLCLQAHLSLLNRILLPSYRLKSV